MLGRATGARARGWLCRLNQHQYQFHVRPKMGREGRARAPTRVCGVHHDERAVGGVLRRQPVRAYGAAARRHVRQPYGAAARHGARPAQQPEVGRVGAALAAAVAQGAGGVAVVAAAGGAGVPQPQVVGQLCDISSRSRDGKSRRDC